MTVWVYKSYNNSSLRQTPTWLWPGKGRIIMQSKQSMGAAISSASLYEHKIRRDSVSVGLNLHEHNAEQIKRNPSRRVAAASCGCAILTAVYK